MLKTLTFAVAVMAASATFAGGPTAAPDGASVRIIAPSDGAVVASPVTFVFGLSGMGVAPASVERANTGHHHLLINRAPFGEEDYDDATLGIPGDENHMHFGGGQTEVSLDLPPGTHTFQLLLGDHNHIPHTTPVMSEVVSITVQ